MGNRQKCVQVLHDYVDSLDDDGIYHFILDQEISSPEIYSCTDCELEYGETDCVETGNCNKRFKEWLNK